MLIVNMGTKWNMKKKCLTNVIWRWLQQTPFIQRKVFASSFYKRVTGTVIKRTHSKK